MRNEASAQVGRFVVKVPKQLIPPAKVIRRAAMGGLGEAFNGVVDINLEHRLPGLVEVGRRLGQGRPTSTRRLRGVKVKVKGVKVKVLNISMCTTLSECAYHL